MEKTPLEEHIQWLEDTLSLSKVHSPFLVPCIKLCISDAKLRLNKEIEDMEKLKDFEVWKEWRSTGMIKSE